MRSSSQESPRSNQIAELRHCDAPKRERRRIVAEGDPLQCAEGITDGECTRRGRDQRVHRNPATFVTPTVRYPALRLFHDQQPPRDEADATEGEKSDDDTHDRHA